MTDIKVAIAKPDTWFDMQAPSSEPSMKPGFVHAVQYGRINVATSPHTKDSCYPAHVFIPTTIPWRSLRTTPQPNVENSMVRAASPSIGNAAPVTLARPAPCGEFVSVWAQNATAHCNCLRIHGQNGFAPALATTSSALPPVFQRLI